MLEDRLGHATIGQQVGAGDHRGNATGSGRDFGVGIPVPAQDAAVGIAGEQAVFGRARRFHDQMMGVAVAHQIIQIDTAVAQQLVDQCHRQQAVGAGADADPFIGNRTVAGANRIDGDHFRAARFQAAQTEFDGIGIMIFGHAPEHQVIGVFPVRFPELPETAAERVQSAGRHVDRTEAAMGGIVVGSVLLRPPAGQRLRLIASGEKGQSVRIDGTRRAQLFRGQLQGFVPFDFLETVFTALADAFHRFFQACRGVMLFDPGRSFGAEYATVDRMIRVAFDVTDFAVLEVDLDAAAAGAHVAGGARNAVAGRFVQGQYGIGHALIVA